jgi:hypothetical protein
MKNKYSIIYGVIALTVFLVVVLGTQVCLGFSKTYAEDSLCVNLRKSENITSEYTCTIGQSYTENGSDFIHVTFSRSYSYFDQKVYLVNEQSKEAIAMTSSN